MISLVLMILIMSFLLKINEEIKIKYKEMKMFDVIVDLILDKDLNINIIYF